MGAVAGGTSVPTRLAGAQALPKAGAAPRLPFPSRVLQRREQPGICRTESPERGDRLLVPPDRQGVLQRTDELRLLRSDPRSTAVADPRQAGRGIGQPPGADAYREVNEVATEIVATSALDHGRERLGRLRVAEGACGQMPRALHGQQPDRSRQRGPDDVFFGNVPHAPETGPHRIGLAMVSNGVRFTYPGECSGKADARHAPAKRRGLISTIMRKAPWSRARCCWSWMSVRALRSQPDPVTAEIRG